MADQEVQRRLAAILAADVAGYTRLMEDDTDGTVAAWQDAREDVIKPQVAGHSGKIVKLTGDGFLVEFSTVKDAVNCAIVMQQGLAASSLDFRIGVNLGDIVDDGEDIHGEGVNVAARLEGLAEPGGIVISGGVYDQVKNRIEVDYEDMGPQEVKNVTDPVQAYGVKIEAVSDSTSVRAAVTDKPSIVVLPFDNLSGDPDQEAFADGMTEDLITDLSKVSGLFVVARNSSYVYKGEIVDVRQVARDLGVRYVLEGSVRKSGERVRINAQLIDAETGGHLWADRYDGTVHDVFELQDEVGAKVIAALSVQITEGEKESLKIVHTHNFEAYELFVRAKGVPFPPIREKQDIARAMFEQVIDMDPSFAGGYAGVATMLCTREMFGYEDDPESIFMAEQMARKAIELDASFGWSHTALGYSLLVQRNYEAALSAALEGVKLQPGDADAHSGLGAVLAFSGKPIEGAASVEHAFQLNPHFVNGPYLNQLGHFRNLAGEYAAAIEPLELNRKRGGPFGPPANCSMAAAYMALGEDEKAEEAVAHMKKFYPEFHLTGWNAISLIRHNEVRERFLGLLISAGAPE